MIYSAPARTRTQPKPGLLVGGLLVIIAAIVAALAYSVLASSSSTATSPSLVMRSERRGVPGGAIPSGTTVFDDTIPGVANLDPALRGAVRRAATDAADDGLEFLVDSGWRSPEYQAQLLREAIATYGSEEAAARWVATPTTSAHVSGEAVDIGPAEATAWLSKHGARYGLCQIYRNEPWHYELRREAVVQGCPRMYADPTRDPRMQHTPGTDPAPAQLARPGRKP